MQPYAEGMLAIAVQCLGSEAPGLPHAALQLLATALPAVFAPVAAAGATLSRVLLSLLRRASHGA